MYEIRTTNRYEKDLRRIISEIRPIEELDCVVELLSANDIPLPKKYKDHKLKGRYSGYRECHIKPEWLLVYKKDKKNLILLLMQTGTHSDLF